VNSNKIGAKKMNKKIVTLTLLLASLQISANSLNNKFYVGGEGAVNMYTTYDVPGASILAGYRWADFSTETGFTKLANDDWGQGLKFKSHNVFADGVYTHAIDDKLEFKSSIGLGVFHSKIYNTGDHNMGWFYSDRERETSLGFRAGIGLQYRLADSLTADFTYKMQTNCNVFIGYMSIFTVGVRYYI
jgi:opacity protein-like surface antigen